MILPWTPDMARLWNRYLLIERTRQAYGRALPLPGTTFPPPPKGGTMEMLLFVATVSQEEYESTLEQVRADMTAWKERVRSSRPSKRPLITSINLDELEIRL